MSAITVSRAAATPVRPVRTRALPRGRRAGVVAIVLAVFTATAAVAYWTTTGNGTGAAATGTLDAPTDVAAVTGDDPGDVDVSWVAPDTGSAPQGYYVERYDTTTNAAAYACGTSPSSLQSGVSCTDTSVPDGEYAYVVTAVLHSWTAASDPSDPVTVVNVVGTSTYLDSSENPSRTGQSVTYTATVSPDSGTATPTGSVTFKDGSNDITCAGGDQELDLSGEATCTVTYTLPGSHTITAEYGGAATFTSSTSASLNQTVNLVAPTTTATYDGTSGGWGWYVSDVEVTLTATPEFFPVATTQYSLNGGAWQTYSGPFMLTSNGTTEVRYRSTDIVGNVEPTKTDNVKIDKDAPVTNDSLTGTLGNAGWYTSDVQVTLTPTDTTSGVADTEYSVDSGAWTPYVAPFQVSSNGIHEVRYRSTDAAGNVEAIKTREVKVDQDQPSTSHGLTGTLGTNGWYRSNVQVTLTASDATSGVALTEYSLTGGAPWTTYAGPFSIGGEGTTTVTYRSTDVASNLESPNKTVEFKVDKTAPVTAISLAGTQGGGGWYRTPVTVTLNATDAVSGVAATEYSLDGGAWQAYPVGGFSVSSDGVHTVLFRSTDNAGNLESPDKMQQFKIDQTAPTTTANLTGTAGTNGWFTGNVTVTLNRVDGHSGIALTQYSLTGGATWTDYTVPFLVNTDGTHTVTFRSTDVAGNVETNKTQEVKRDASIPDGTITFPGTSVGEGNAWRQGCGTTSNQTASFDICGSASDPHSGIAKVEFRLQRLADNHCLSATGQNPGAFPNNTTACTGRLAAAVPGVGTHGWSAITGNIADGSYTLTVWITNGAGLERTVTRNFTKGSD